MTWDDVLIDFIEEHVPAEFVKEMIRQADQGPGIPWREVSEERKQKRRR